MPRLTASRIALALLLALPTGAALAEDAPAAPSGTAAPAAQSQRPPVVSVVAATKREIVSSVIVTGTLVAREEVQVAADVDGLKVEEIFADEGDTVAAGAVLARLATDSLAISLAQNESQLASADAAIAQAKGQIVEAKAAAVQARSQLDRSRALTGKGVTSQDVLDQRIAAADQANARLAVAEQALAAAEASKAVVEAQRREWQLKLAKAEVKAPKGGLVLSRAAKVGAIVSGASGALFRLAENGDVELEAAVSETTLVRIRPGQAVDVLPAGATEQVRGTVRLVSPEVDVATRLGKVRIALPKAESLRVGAFARGTVEIDRSSGLALPASAVLTSGDAPAVQVARDGKIETRTVETGLSGGGYVEIVRGLAEGEQVVARSGTFLRDGDAVEAVVAKVEGAKG